ncbi:hypothetical protein ACO2Q3_16285 [Caulobacter sp. KR2-114]|uniref:hypothetical protein n=1 Tax=Caulobacter sp. KR2-114 TaxID=3400912 RepID=UPI003BFDE38B
MDASTPTDSTPVAAQPATARFATRLASASGRDLQVEGYWRPVLALVEATSRGWALTCRIRTADAEARAVALDSLNAVDRERVTLAAVRQGVKVLPQADRHSGGPAPMALIPIPWACAKAERVRRELLRLGGLARGARQVVPVAEFTDIEPGAPAAALAEAAAGLRPMFGGVLVRLAGGGSDVPRLMDRGFAGASLEADSLKLSEERPILVGLAALLKAVGPMPGLHGVNSVATLEAARDAGFAWASLDLTRGGWHLFNAGLEALRAPRD